MIWLNAITYHHHYPLPITTFCLRNILKLGPKLEENEVLNGPRLSNKLKSLKVSKLSDVCLVGVEDDDGCGGGESSYACSWYG